jgi:RNA polymerase sigma factor (TIGR02999 family)
MSDETSDSRLAAGGDAAFLSEVYDQLRVLARARLANERDGHSLQATELVHEAFLKIRSSRALAGNDRAAFFRAAAEAMRRILIDHARGKGRAKRGGGARRVLSDVAELAQEQDSEQILALEEALCRLEQEEPQAALVLKLRFYAGMSVPETAEATGLSERTVKREWQYARAWLFRALDEGPPPGPERPA